MAFNVTVLYPNESDATFNMDYYLKDHMPLVMKHFGPHGLKGYEVTEFVAGQDGSKPYSVQCTLRFAGEKEFHAAVSSEDAKPVFGDVPNFSNKGPLLLPAHVKGSA